MTDKKSCWRRKEIACNPYRLRYWNVIIVASMVTPPIYCMQSIPLAVLKRTIHYVFLYQWFHCMQSIPLAVLKLLWEAFDWTDNLQIACNPYRLRYWNNEISLLPIQAYVLHAIHTACGIETKSGSTLFSFAEELHAIHTACGIETKSSKESCRQAIIACNPYRLRCWKRTGLCRKSLRAWKEALRQSRRASFVMGRDLVLHVQYATQ